MLKRGSAARILENYLNEEIASASPRNKNQKTTKSMSQQKPKISTSFTYETLEETLDVKPKGGSMIIGIPKETSFQENRIALTPEA